MEADRPSRENFENLADFSDGELLRRWKVGDERAADVIVDRYAIRLIALVASKMNQRFRNTVDPEDIVQSAMGSFFTAARQSRLQVSQSVALWHLLATFAKRKMLRSIERQTAAKRGSDLNRIPIENGLERWATDPSLQLAPAVDDLLAAISKELPADLQEILDRLMLSQTQQEIAAELRITERTVRRRVVRLRNRLSPQADGAAESDEVAFVSTSLPRVGYNEFVLGKLIGAGGFGKVYRASMQTGTPTTVAVKFLRKAFWQNAEAKRSFIREVDQASRIEHASVVRYLGWGESPQGGPYVLAQWIDGLPLTRRRPVSPVAFVHLLRRICDTMSAVHDLGIVHGDLTPENILVGHADQFWITDFGFSQSLQNRASAVRQRGRATPLLGGTLGFAAPEQISDSFGQIGCATDIYAIGGLAYWYLAGRAPHGGCTTEASLASTIGPNNVDTTDLPCNSPATEVIKRVATEALQKSVASRPRTINSISELLAISDQ